MKPAQNPVTQAQADAWNALASAFGNELFTLNHPSAHDIADAAIDALQAEADQLLQNPAVRDAYDHLLPYAN